MKAREIKAELIRQGHSLTDVANEAGISISQVSQCISGEGIYQRVREIIARRIGRKVTDVFNDPCHPQPKGGNYRWCRTA